MASAGGTREELNLVPYLDIVTTLMIALLAIASYNDLGLRQAAVKAAYAKEKAKEGAGAGPAGEAHGPLTVEVDHDGFVLDAGDGGHAAKLMAVDGALPYARLAEVLRALRGVPNAPERAVLTAEKDIPYRTLVTTLDTMRRDDAGPLYPDVAILTYSDAPTQVR